jgi:hypothetical protein
MLWIVGFAVTTGAVVTAWSWFVPSEKLCPDFMQFWTAGQLVASGHSPYSAEDQERVQRQLGWEKKKQGLGIYEFLPYYYPPWLALACTLFLQPGYPTAKVTWLVINAELVLLSGFHLGRLLYGVPRWIALATVCCYSFSTVSVLIGQTSPLILFLVVASWRLLEAGRDRLAGGVLALVLTKPQIGTLVVCALLIWAARQRRWPVLVGFCVCLLSLCLVSFAVMPHWPRQLLGALERSPLVTRDSPWLSVTWWAVLKTLEIKHPLFLPVYLAVAVPSLLLLVCKAWNREATVGSVLACSIPLTFMVVHYARLYDLLILIIPLLLMLPGRLTAPRTATLFMGCLLLSFVQLHWVRLGDPYRCEVSYFWLPALLALLPSIGLVAGAPGSAASPGCQQKWTVG